MRWAITIVSILACWIIFSGFPAPDNTPENTKDDKPLAKEWEYVTSSDNADHFMNIQTIRSSGDLVKAWILSTREGNHNGGVYRSSKLLREFNCVNEQSRVIKGIRYSDRNGYGEVVDQYDTDTPTWSAVTPESVGEGLWKFACRIHELHVIGPDKWKRIDRNDSNTYYISSSAHRQAGNIARMIVLHDQIEPFVSIDGTVTRSGKDLYEFDCLKRMIRITNNSVQYSEGMGRGTVVRIGSFLSPDESEWSSVNSNSLAEAILNFACKKQ